MTAWLVGVWVHLVAGILLTGYALYWAIMATGLPAGEDPELGARPLERLNRSRWPPIGVPPALRLPFPFLGWGFLALLLLTGLFLLERRGILLADVLSGDLAGARFGRVLSAKLGLFALLGIGQLAAHVRPGRTLALANGALALAIVLLSAFLRH